MKIVQKFGGTSVGTPERMLDVLQLVLKCKPRVLVLSAIAGTTNKLYDIAMLLNENKIEPAQNNIEKLRQEYIHFVNMLFHKRLYLENALQTINQIFKPLCSLYQNGATSRDTNNIVAIGEYLSTSIFFLLLKNHIDDVALLNSYELFLKYDSGNPDMSFIQEKFNDVLHQYNKNEILLIQGFICQNSHVNTDNFERGGSDFTATIAGNAIEADLIQIWTDIDGLHNNDPRFVENTITVKELSYKEASELAFFGAKILHPRCIEPARKKNIPIQLRNTFQPEFEGTYISSEANKNTIKAITAKDGLTAIRIQSARMFMTYGFLSKVFSVFEKYRTPIDLITTSEVSVSLTIDNDQYLDAISKELQLLGTIEITQNQSIVCIVGDFLAHKPGLSGKVLKSVEKIPVRMISYGGSENNISILVNTSDKKETLVLLQNGIFNLNNSCCC